MTDFFSLDPATYSIGINLFIRGLGCIYIIAYVPFLFQIRGLIGKDGILPLQNYLRLVRIRLGTKRFYYLPTLWWINASDTALLILVWAGIVLGILLACGIYPVLILFCLYLVHLSLVSGGQDFLSFGWEIYLIELTIGGALLVATEPYNRYAWIGLNILLMRFYVQAGASKLLSHDPNWRNLRALTYHYLTQPLPNTIAWYVHKFPVWFHKCSVMFTFYAEMVVPLFIFAPPIVRLAVFFQLLFLQLGIWATGNLSYLNYLSVVSSLFLLANTYLEPFLSNISQGTPSPIWWYLFISLLGILFSLLQTISFIQMFFPNRLFNTILYNIQPFHLASPHGIFAVMTTKRFEIIVEGSNDGIEWREYEFRHKPGNLKRRPKRVSPWQPRLDWQAWFLPFSPAFFQFWFQQFMVKLLKGSPVVIRLLKHNPFPDKPPLYIRALIYDYVFTTFEEKKATGCWWKRTFAGIYAPMIYTQ